MDPKINDLYGKYRSGHLDRRTFLRNLSLLAGGTAAAINLLPLLEQSQAFAGSFKQPNSGGEADLQTEFIQYPAVSGPMKAFMARPRVDAKLPAVIVIHENRGLQPHIVEVTKRMAKEGFMALGPDALSPLGGTPDNDEGKAREMMRELDRETTVKDFVAAVKYLKTNPLTNGKVGCTGFCWGGAMTNQVAVNAPDLVAAAPYYGSQPATEDVPRIRASMILHYAGEDQRINSGIKAFEEALEKASIEFQTFVYDGAQHAFNNDSNPARYHEEAAKLAWKRTIEFFKEKLEGSSG